jgi:two-component system, chemotaxis family, chemotaxis protein CheY
MKRVLIVDDSNTVRMYHRQLVEALGLEVEEAQNGLEGLEKALTDSFDLMLVDINMPKMDGYLFLGEVRRSPELMSVPAIMISTEGQPLDKEKAYKAGANLYLCKPVRPEVLQNYVRLLAGVWA